MSGEDFNLRLASACQNCGAACCKRGKIFLPREEYDRIRLHAASLGPGEEAEFVDRTTDNGSYFLYDQKDGCQFLDAKNLCRLHAKGVKPSECFWWPYHVFPAESGGLEIRLFTGCCDAHKEHHSGTVYPKLIEVAANRIGFDVIREFRRNYAGTCDTKPIGPIKELVEPTTA